MRWASVTTLDARNLWRLATVDPVRDIAGYPVFESRFNEPIDFGLVP